MQRYQWPGFAMQLVRELQKQQNNSQLCDTLLQTDGISVPTHGCILTAFSPYLSQRLASSPSPPAGQRVRLQLQDVKAQTLLKLVSLLYSGELEVNKGDEQNDVLGLACRFGITGLLEGQRDVGTLMDERQEKILESVRNCFDTEERRTEESRKMADAQAEMTDRVVIDAPVEKRSCLFTGTQMVYRQCVDHDTQATNSPLEPGASEFPTMLQNQNITQENCFSTVSCPEIHDMDSGATSIGNTSSGMLQNSALTSKDVPTRCLSLYGKPNFATIQEDGAYQQSSDFSDDTQSELENQHKNSRGDGEQPCQSDRYVTPGDKRISSTDRKRAHIGMKSLKKMKDMQKTAETAQSSCKVKLRRRTEVWEVVSMRGRDEIVSDFTYLMQNDSNHRTLHADFENVLPPPWTDQHSPVQDPDPSFSLTSFNSTISPTHTTSDSQVPSSGSFTPHQDCVLEAPSLLHGPCFVDESDEQIEKMLEDVMMGLNILPNQERDSNMSSCIQPNHDGGTAICQVHDSRKDVGHSQIPSAVSAANCGFYQDSAPTSCLSRDTDVFCDIPAQCPPRYLNHEAPKTRPVTPAAFFSTRQKSCQHHKRFPQVDNEIFPLANGSDPYFCHTLPSPCLDDMRLPRCLSPIESYISPFYSNNATNFANAFQPAPHIQSPPWVSGSLQMPLKTITQRRKESASFPQEKNCHLKQSQIHVQMDGGNRTGLHSMKKALSAEGLKVPKQKLKRRVTEEKEEVAPRRKRIHSCPQESSGALFPHKDVKVSDATRSQLGFNICKVSLSSNNVLAKDRQLAENCCNVKVVRKPRQLSVVTESQKQKHRQFKTEQACIKTGRFVRNKEKSLNEMSLEKRLESVAETPADKQDVKKQKCGILPKPKAPVLDKQKSHDEGGHQLRDGTSKDSLEKGDKAKGFKKRRMTQSTVVEEVSGMKTQHVGRKSKPDTDVKDRQKPEIQHLQKFVKSQLSKTKSKTNRESLKPTDRKREAGPSSMNGSTRVQVMEQRGSRNCDTSRCGGSLAVTVNNNRNYIFNTSQDKKKKSQQEGTDSFQQPGSSSNAIDLEEEGNTSKAVRRNSREATTCSTEVSDSTQQPVAQDVRGPFPGHLPQKYKVLPCESTLLQTPGPCLVEHGQINKSSGFEDEVDEEEVDVLLLSPVKVHTKESGLPHMEIIPDEEVEVEEEESDIDVTGDEAD